MNSASLLLTNTKFSSYILFHNNQTNNCNLLCLSSATENKYQCILCLNSLYYSSNKYDDLFLIKNGLRFINDIQNPRYLFQTINYKWLLRTSINNFFEWQLLFKNLENNFIKDFYSKIFARMSFWWTSEIFSSFTIMEQLEQEKYFLFTMKFIIILVFLTLCTGVLGVFAAVAILLNFVTCIAAFTLLNDTLTIENISYFVTILIVCSQYSMFYTIR